ncbi:unnamed protein product [Lymnaea stagnalis]|uniref:Calpain-5 n=1 Tax=Lymnaea stagnalis TaxID=6523 RepID=A0AAV2INW3_LYMST
MPAHFRGQNYKDLKKGCLKRGVLFEDPEFPACSKSVFFSKVDNEIEWMRPNEICKAPRLIVDGATCDDLVTGVHKSTWFITACTALAHEQKLWQKVIPDINSQEFSDNNPYAGIFRFQFWRYGEWTDVVIDDRLPTRDGKLIFLHSKSKNEFWSALLEKAYAKLFGDYESMATGHTADALVDFTGGVSETFVVDSFDITEEAALDYYFKKMSTAFENRALINAVISVDEDMVDEEGPFGLLLGHGYNITMIKEIEIQKGLQGTLGERIRIVRLFNPWGEREWTGPWSDGSAEIKRLPLNEWAKMGIKFGLDGEFCMSFEDFMAYFTCVDICHFVNTNFFSLKKTWHEAILFSEWKISGRNGGNKVESNNFLSNPQYVFDVTAPEDTIMISLEQRDVTLARVSLADKKNTIGFYIMKVEQNRNYRVHTHGLILYSSKFSKSRNVFASCTLRRGRYVIFPCCDRDDAVGDFMLRLYTSNKSNARELTLEAPSAGCCGGQYKLVTTIIVERVEGVELPPGEKGGMDPYVVVKCEGEKVQSETKVNDPAPTFDMACTFYRKSTTLPIVVEVYSSRKIFSVFLGEARISWASNETGEQKEFPLYARATKKEPNILVPGKVFVFIQSSDDIKAL